MQVSVIKNGDNLMSDNSHYLKHKSRNSFNIDIASSFNGLIAFCAICASWVWMRNNCARKFHAQYLCMLAFFCQCPIYALDLRNDCTSFPNAQYQSASKHGRCTFLYSAMRELVCKRQLWARAALRQLCSYKVG